MYLSRNNLLQSNIKASQNIFSMITSKEDKIIEACTTQGRDKKFIQNFDLVNLKRQITAVAHPKS
jgi:hypothetical protein